MTDTLNTTNEVTEALAEAEAADARAAELEAAIIDGSTTATVAQIEKAESAGRFARLRAKAAEVKAQRAAEATRLEQIAALRADVDTFTAGDLGEVQKRYVAAVEALAALSDVLKDREAAKAALESRARALGVHHRTSVVVDGPKVHEFRPAEFIDRAIEEAREGRARGMGLKDDGVHPLHTPERAAQIRAENDARHERALATRARKAAEREQRESNERAAAERFAEQQRIAEEQFNDSNRRR